MYHYRFGWGGVSFENRLVRIYSDGRVARALAAVRETWRAERILGASRRDPRPRLRLGWRMRLQASLIEVAQAAGTAAAAAYRGDAEELETLRQSMRVYESQWRVTNDVLGKAYRRMRELEEEVEAAQRDLAERVQRNRLRGWRR